VQGERVLIRPFHVLVENTTMLQMCAELDFHAHDRGPHIKRVLLEIKNVTNGPCGTAG